MRPRDSVQPTVDACRRSVDRARSVSDRFKQTIQKQEGERNGVSACWKSLPHTNFGTEEMPWTYSRGRGVISNTFDKSRSPKAPSHRLPISPSMKSSWFRPANSPLPTRFSSKSCGSTGDSFLRESSGKSAVAGNAPIKSRPVPPLSNVNRLPRL